MRFERVVVARVGAKGREREHPFRVRRWMGFENRGGGFPGVRRRPTHPRLLALQAYGLGGARGGGAGGARGARGARAARAARAARGARGARAARAARGARGAARRHGLVDGEESDDAEKENGPTFGPFLHRRRFLSWMAACVIWWGMFG